MLPLSLLALLVQGSCAHPTVPAGQRLLSAHQGRLTDGDTATRPDGCATLTWTAATLEAQFDGTAVAIDVGCEAPLPGDGPCLASLAATVDGVRRADIDKLAPLPERRMVAAGLAPGRHRLVIARRSEAQLGAVRVCAVTAPGGRLLPPPPPRPHQLLILGDSISAGYGNLCEGPKDGAPLLRADGTLTYGALSAQSLDADVRIVAWSGLGLWRNGDGTFEHTLPQRWAEVAQPGRLDAVVVNLGTNDFRQEAVDDGAFVDTYVRLVSGLLGSYRGCHVFLALGPMLSDALPQGAGPGAGQLSHALRLLQQTQQRLADRGWGQQVHLLRFATQDGRLGFGCDYHPNLATHRQMARTLTEALQRTLGWSRF
jgi:hypothetical protein